MPHDLSKPIPLSGPHVSGDRSGVPIARIEQVRALGKLRYAYPGEIDDADIVAAWGLIGTVWAEVLDASAFAELRSEVRNARYVLLRRYSPR